MGPSDAIISTDIGNNCAIGNAYPSFESGRKYLAPGLFGPCGYGFPSILGAKIGHPEVPVVGFAGDGAFGISVNELTACGRCGVKVSSVAELERALADAVEGQMQRNETTL